MNIDLTNTDYRKVGTVYRANDNDYLICYNNTGLCSLNIDEIQSYYEMYDHDSTLDILNSGKMIYGSISDYINKRS